MSPILVRPVREQLEHDRIIRLLQTKYRRKFDAAINPRNEQNAPVTSGTTTLFPDLVLCSLERGRRLQAVVEVETGESVNHLEALAEWAHFARVRALFHLYVPSSMVDVARRLCEDNQIHVNEIWSYHAIGDEVRFALVHRSRTDVAPQPRAKVAAPASRTANGAAKNGAAKNGAAKDGAVKKPARAGKRPAVRAARPARAKSAKAAKKPARAQKRK